MTNDTIEILTVLKDLVECGRSDGVLDGEFKPSERNLLRYMEQEGLVQVVWRITSKGRRKLKEADGK